MPPYDVKIRNRSEPGDASDQPVDAPPPPVDVNPTIPRASPLPSIDLPPVTQRSNPPPSAPLFPDLPLDARADLMSAKVALAGPASGKIEIRGADGQIVNETELPPPVDAAASMDGAFPRDSVGPIRRDSLGMRMLFRDSWAPDARRRRKTATNLRDFARSVGTWVLLLAVSIDVLALVLEPLYMLRYGAPLRAGIATAFAAVGLAFFFAGVVAIPLGFIHGLVRLIGRAKRPWNLLWPLPLLLLASEVVSDVAQHKVIHALSLEQGQMILTALFSVAIVVATGITRIRKARLRVTLGFSIAAATLVANMYMPAVLTREPRDLLWLSGVIAFAAVFYPLRRAAVALSHEKVSRLIGSLGVVSVGLLYLAPFVCPDWRTWASDSARFAPRLARFDRMFVDLDGDNFSPVAWGTDCDDWVPARHPAVIERPDGVDHNCNGKLMPKNPTDAMRGLAAPVGSADAASGEYDRVVLVTVDCFRNDALTPEVTPNLVKLAARGVRLEHLYSVGARTAMSLPFQLRGSYLGTPVAKTLHDAHVSTTAYFGYRHSTLEGNVFDDFDVVKRPDIVDHRIRAPELTDIALDDLRDPAHLKDHFLWVHYFDAHGPRTRRVLPADLPDYPMPPLEKDKEMSLYLTQLNFIDRHLGRLVEGIDQLPGHTLLILTNDHGEGFGQHNVYEHGVSAFEQIIHAPGIVVGPGFTPGRYGHVLSQRDIAATVLGAFGLVAKHPEIETFGRSWIRMRAPTEGTPVLGAPLHEFAVSYETTTPFERWGDAPMASIVDDHGKYSVSYVDGVERFYAIDEDPGELNELAAAAHEDAARYRDRLETFRDLDIPPH